MNAKINLTDKLAQFTDHWFPKTVAQLNDLDVMVIKVKGALVWYKHDGTDDSFLVLKGRLRIRLPGHEIELGPGELYIVLKGVEHQPFAEEEVQLLLIEPKSTPNTGDESTAAKRQVI